MSKVVNSVISVFFLVYVNFSYAAKLPTAGSGIQSSTTGSADPLTWIEGFLKDYGKIGLIGIVVAAFAVWGWQLLKIFGSQDKNKWEEFAKVFVFGIVMIAVVVSAAIYGASLIA